ncbi:receptor-like serine/threonine-protein kinase SD1-6 isoform X3 [Wolffia australiana]
MSPEYAMDGTFSVKSDVFSFGVLVLEMISGRKNRAIFDSDHRLNLVGDAWNLWKEGKEREIVDSSLGASFPTAEALKCIKIGLLCVQERPEDRPEIETVVLMFGGNSEALPRPKPPGFIVARVCPDGSSNSSNSVNDITFTAISGR